MKRLPKLLNANDKSSWVRAPQEYGPVGATLGQRMPRFRDRRTREAKELKAYRRKLEDACGSEPTPVQALYIERICEQHAELIMYARRKATSDEPLSEHQEQVSIALANTHARYLKEFRDTLPPPMPPTQTADKLVTLIRGMDEAALDAFIKALDEMNGEEVKERLEGAPPVRIYMPDNGRDPVPPEIQVREPASESPMRVEPEPVREWVEEPNANHEPPQRQEQAKKPQPAPNLPPNITVEEIKPQTGRVSEGATLWTGR